MEALRRSVGDAAAETAARKKAAKRPRKGSGGREGDADADRRQEASQRLRRRNLLAIAAPSMKTALKAWGAGSNLFYQGVAERSGPDVQWESLRKRIDAYR